MWEKSADADGAGDSLGGGGNSDVDKAGDSLGGGGGVSVP